MFSLKLDFPVVFFEINCYNMIFLNNNYMILTSMLFQKKNIGTVVKTKVLPQ